jgi:CRP/FNR family transcriptional regulator, cyclic AMP receptor protein
MVDPSRVAAVSSLAELPPDVQAALAEAFDEVTVAAGKRIASQGDFAYELFAIVEGTARIEQDGQTVATLGPGSLIGEIGLMLTGRRTAAIVAETPMVLLAMFEQSFRRLCAQHQEFVKAVRGEGRDRFTRAATV